MVFDPNKFKKSVKEWVRTHSEGTVSEFVDFCEEQIPPSCFAANQWLVEQSVNWYKHILNQRKTTKVVNGDTSDH